jgi:hypothetical protein
MRCVLPALFALILSGCSRASGPPLDPAALVGYWQWIESQGGQLGDTLSRARLGHRIAVEFGADGSYSEYKNDYRSIHGRFAVVAGYAFDTGDSIISVVQFDTTSLFGRVIEPELAIRRVGVDTLILFDTGSDGFEHTFVRAEQPDWNRRR